jgi:predicted transcriptional regulator|tara:strand:- start:1 stop:192 length:192 start_codon:yes stop_codon:yes gene_type:complete
MPSKKTSFHIKLRNDLLEHLRIVADRNAVTMTSVIEDALENHFAGITDTVRDLERKLAAAGLQ